MVNRRADYQRLFGSVGENQQLSKKVNDEISSLMLEDSSYAKGFFENSLRRTLNYISPTVGKSEGRPFSLKVDLEISSDGIPKILIGASVRPKLQDNQSELIKYFGEELLGLSRMKNYQHFISYIAVNGELTHP